MPEYVRIGDRYVVPRELIKYFYIDTSDKKLVTKLKDGEEINLTYQGDDAYENCLRNYVYLLDLLHVDYPKWLDQKTLRKIKYVGIDDEED